MNSKDQLLGYLKENKGQWISGEALSTRIDVTRSAVWKQICALRDEGYRIESSPRKGYILRSVPDLLLPAEIQQNLGTEFFGKVGIYHFIETDSTNIQAKALALDGAPEGTLVVAEKQNMGKGRKGRKWFSDSIGGIYCTMILRPSTTPNEALKIPLLTALVAVKTLLKTTSLKPTIKWPNDILVNGKKLGGILTEISTEVDAVDFVIVGFGININTESFPEDIKDIATSVTIETGIPMNRAAFLKEYLSLYEQTYGIFTREGFNPLMGEWRKLTHIIGHMITVDMIGKRLTGEVEDIDREGALLLRDEEGEIHRIYSGDVTYL